LPPLHNTGTLDFPHRKQACDACTTEGNSCFTSHGFIATTEKPFIPAGSESYTGTEAHSLLRKEASNHLSQKTN